MSLILNIDTANETAHVSLAKDGTILDKVFNREQKSHASFLQPAIQQLVSGKGLNLKDIDAVAVTEGPGSYTGLRIGLASAKGICYALHKPLILINTLDVLAKSVLLNADRKQPYLICPMVDARRMEVFTAVYDTSFNKLMNPCAMILEKGSFEEMLFLNKIYFTGSGADKFQKICVHSNAGFEEAGDLIIAMGLLSYINFTSGCFSDVAYSQPNYVKEFKSQ